MTRALFFAAITFALPPACEKLMAKKGAEPADAPTSVPAPPPPPPSATTPPVWVPPAVAQPVDTTSPTPTPTGTPNGPDYAKAREASEAKDWKKVKALLEKRAKAGKASPDEAQLLYEACVASKDKLCVASTAAKYPGVSKPTE